jgi:type VI secretion system protein ImpJ
MFMSPQHLQAQDAYHELLLAGRLAALSPYPWGVLHVEVDQEALRAGQLQLLSFSGILPDGTPLSFDKGHPEAPPLRPLADQLRAGVKSVEVYLGVPKERDGLESYASDGNRQSAARYLVSEQPVADRLSVGSIVPVAFAQRNTRLLFGSEPRDDFEALQIAEVIRDGLGAAVLEPGFVPPCLRIDASPWLLDETRKSLQAMLGKQQQLADARKHRDASSVEFTPATSPAFSSSTRSTPPSRCSTTWRRPARSTPTRCIWSCSAPRAHSPPSSPGWICSRSPSTSTPVSAPPSPTSSPPCSGC